MFILIRKYFARDSYSFYLLISYFLTIFKDTNPSFFSLWKKSGVDSLYIIIGYLKVHVILNLD